MFTCRRSLSIISDIHCRAQWLSRIISWVLSSKEDIQVPQNNTTPILETITEIYGALQQWALVPQKVKSHPSVITRADFSQPTSAGLLSPSRAVHGASLGTGALPTASPHLLTFSTREQQLKDLSKGLIANSLRLLVAVSGLLSRESHENLCGLLWQDCLTQAPCEIQASVGLIPHCGLSRPSLTYYHHTGYVFDYAVRRECSDGHARTNTDRHPKVCLGTLL